MNSMDFVWSMDALCQSKITHENMCILIIMVECNATEFLSR